MGDKIVAVPGIGNVQFPASMADADINSAIEQEYAKRSSTASAKTNAGDRAAAQVQSDSGYDQNHPVAAKLMDWLNPVLNKPMSQYAVDQSRNAGQLESDSLDKAYGAQSLNRGILDRAGNALLSIPAGTARVAYGIGGMTPAEAGLTAGSVASGNPEVAGAYWATRGTGNLLGVNGKSSITQALSPNATPEQVGQPFLDASMVASGAAARGASPGEVNTVPSKSTVAQKISDAINPHPDERPSFQQNVTDNIDSVLSRDATPVEGRSQLADRFKVEADKARQEYRDLVDPVKDVQVYGGSTLGQLEARLKIINSTLNPTYEKGGLSAQAALSSEQKVALTEEAARTRDVLNKETAKALGIKPEDVAAARQKMGALGNVADKMRWYLDNEKYTNNKAANQPSQAPDITVMGAANMARQALWEKVMGNPADKSVRNVLKNYTAQPDADLNFYPNVNQPQNQRTPLWEGVTESGKPPIDVQTSSPKDIQGILDRFVRQRKLPMEMQNVLSEAQRKAIEQAAINRKNR